MGLFSKNYGAVEVDAAMKQRIESNSPEGSVIRVRPYPENASISGSQKLLQTLYKTQDSAFMGFLNTSDVSTFEIWYDDGQIEFYYYIEDLDMRERFLKQIGAFFEDSEVRVIRDEEFPEVSQGEWLAGARFHLAHHFFEPVRFPGGKRDMDNDPYQEITNDITAKDETRMVIQVALKPATQNWTSTWGKDVADYGEKLRDDDTVVVREGLSMEEKEVSVTEEIRAAAKDIMQQRGKKGFHVNLRMLAIGPTRDKTIEQCRSVGRIYEQTHEEVTGQTLVPRPQESDEIPALIDDMTFRRGNNMDLPQNPISRVSRKVNRWFRGTYKTMIMTMPEVTGLAHIPDQSIKNNKIDWNRLSVEGTIPPDAPEYEEWHGGELDDQRSMAEYEASDEIDAPDGEFESEWDDQDDAIEQEESNDEVDELIDDSMDDPMEEFIE